MRTYTFYSYKGGVGRTLTLANFARSLARSGQKVFAVDLDLEAPGLHYKLDPGEPSMTVERGFVDYVQVFLAGGSLPPALAPYTVQVRMAGTSAKPFRLLPAGAAPSPAYWQKLAGIDWNDLFYADEAPGVPFFLELKERIAAEFSPDALLIDSPAGITAIGGVTTTLLADQVRCLLLNDRESLEGTREVLRSIRRAERLPGQAPVEILPIAYLEAGGRTEEQLLSEVREFLNQPAEDLASTLAISKVLRAEAGNLTTAEGIVQLVPDTKPVPGYDLVIFDFIGAGLRFRTIVEAGQRFVPTLRERLFPGQRSTIAYAVIRDRLLRHRFSRAVAKAGEPGALHIHVTFQFCVTAPRLLVEKLAYDPLRQLQEEVGDLLESAALALDWEVLGDHDDFLEEALQRFHHEPLAVFNALAGELGLEIDGLQITHELSPELAGYFRARRSAEVAKVIREAEHEHAFRLTGPRREHLQIPTALAGMATTRHLISTIENLQLVFRQTVAGINSTSPLTTVLSDLEEILQKIRGSSIGMELVSSVPAALVAPSTSRLEVAAAKSLSIIGSIGGDCRTRIRLLSLILRLLGEVATGNEADARRLTVEIRDLVPDLAAVVTHEQWKYLRYLQDLEAVKADLREGIPGPGSQIEG